MACCAAVPLLMGVAAVYRRVQAGLEPEEQAPVVAVPQAAVDGESLEVAIIGCGLAGATTALELLLQGQGRIKISIFEQSPSLLASTSSMIAATINMDTAYREWLHGKAMFSVLDMVRDGFTASGMSGDTRWANFLANTAVRLTSDPRSADAQKRKVFRRSHQRLVTLVRRFPELCAAIIGYWCCEAGGEARQHLEHAAEVRCPAPEDPASSTMGLFQVTSDPEVCGWMRQAADAGVGGCDEKAFGDRLACEANGHHWQDVAYSFYNASATRRRLSGFLQSDSAALCSLVEHRITGFARSEVLFALINDIFRREGVRLGLSCNVADLRPGLDGRIEVATDSACSLGRRKFDKVVVAAAAASVPLLSAVDPQLGSHLVGIRGYGLSGAAGAPSVPPEQSGRGIHFMDMSRKFAAAYVRATVDLRVKVWGGHDVSASDRDLKPPYPFCGPAEADHIFRDGPACARTLIDSPSTERLAGMRPVPSIGNVPLIKRYTGEWSNLFLNSGYGYNGYDLSWFASMCTVRWLLGDVHADSTCATATKQGAET